MLYQNDTSKRYFFSKHSHFNKPTSLLNRSQNLLRLVAHHLTLDSYFFPLFFIYRGPLDASSIINCDHICFKKEEILQIVVDVVSSKENQISDLARCAPFLRVLHRRHPGFRPCETGASYSTDLGSSTPSLRTSEIWRRLENSVSRRNWTDIWLHSRCFDRVPLYHVGNLCNKLS